MSQFAMIFVTQVFIVMQITTQVHSLCTEFHLFSGLERCQLMRDLLYKTTPFALSRHKTACPVSALGALASRPDRAVWNITMYGPYNDYMKSYSPYI